MLYYRCQVVLRCLIPDTPQHVRYTMTIRKSKTSKGNVTDAVQVALQVAAPEAPTYTPPENVRDLGKKHSHCVAASEKVESLYRDWAIENVGPTLPQVTLQRAKLDENGAVVKGPDGKAIMCSWLEYDLNSEEFAAFGTEYKVGAVADIIESGVHAKLCLPGQTVAALVAMSDDEVGKLPEEQNKAAKTVRKAVRDLAYTRLSRAKKWFSEANKAAKAVATGTVKDPAAPFHQWIVDETKKGGLGLLMRRRKSSAEKYPERTIDEATVKILCRLMARGWADERVRKDLTMCLAATAPAK